MPDQSNTTIPADQNAKPDAKPDAETQSLVDMFLINGMEMIYDDKASKDMLARIGINEDPTKAIAEFLVDVVMRVVKSAQGAGKTIPPDVVLHGSNFLLTEVFKVLDAGGMEPLTEEQAVGVWQMATSIYLDKAVKSGLITEQELMALSEEAKQTETGQKMMQAEEQVKGQAVAAPVAAGQAPAPVGLAAPQGGI